MNSDAEYDKYGICSLSQNNLKICHVEVCGDCK